MGSLETRLRKELAGFLAGRTTKVEVRERLHEWSWGQEEVDPRGYDLAMTIECLFSENDLGHLPSANLREAIGSELSRYFIDTPPVHLGGRQSKIGRISLGRNTNDASCCCRHCAPRGPGSGQG